MVEEKHLVDLVVIGSGPGGVAAAFFARYFSRDLDVMLIEKRRSTEFSKYHEKCGGAVSDRFMKLLPTSILKEKVILKKISTIVEYWEDTPPVTEKVKGYIIDRTALLKDMINSFQEIGGRFIYDEVLRVEPLSNGCVEVFGKGGHIAIAKLVVVASGACSRFGNEPTNNILLSQYVIESTHSHNSLKFFYRVRYDGQYKWEFPVNDKTYHVGFRYNTDKYDGAYMVRQSRFVSIGGLSDYVQGSVVRIGDAGGMTNPITLAGIKPAFISGKKLAAFIARAKKKGIPLKNAALDFEHWLKKSPYHTRKYLEAYERLRKMTSEQLVDFSYPFRCTSVKRYWLLFKKARDWPLYRAFINAQDYSF